MPEETLTTRPLPLHQRDQRLAEQEGADQVGRQHRAHAGRRRLEGAHRALARLVPAAHDAGVVDQDVEPAEFAADELGELPDAVVVRDVQLMMADVQAFALQPPGRRLALGRIAAGQDDARAAPGELPAGLEAHAAIAAGDHRDLARRALLHGRHPPTALPSCAPLALYRPRSGPRPPRSTSKAAAVEIHPLHAWTVHPRGTKAHDRGGRYAQARNRSDPGKDQTG